MQVPVQNELPLKIQYIVCAHYFSNNVKELKLIEVFSTPMQRYHGFIKEWLIFSYLYD